MNGAIVGKTKEDFLTPSLGICLEGSAMYHAVSDCIQACAGVGPFNAHNSCVVTH